MFHFRLIFTLRLEHEPLEDVNVAPNDAVHSYKTTKKTQLGCPGARTLSSKTNSRQGSGMNERSLSLMQRTECLPVLRRFRDPSTHPQPMATIENRMHGT
jgi:hypothetical protein